MIIEALEIVVFIYRHILAPFMYFISQFNIQKQLPSLLNVYRIQKILALLIFVRLTQLCTNFVLVLSVATFYHRRSARIKKLI